MYIQHKILAETLSQSFFNAVEVICSVCKAHRDPLLMCFRQAALPRFTICDSVVFLILGCTAA